MTRPAARSRMGTGRAGLTTRAARSERQALSSSGRTAAASDGQLGSSPPVDTDDMLSKDSTSLIIHVGLDLFSMQPIHS